ncbi:B-cell receptor-associated protein 29-like [Glandiceps talaboti]
MSLLWTTIALFLYAEIAIVTILLLPFRPTMWKKIFNWSWFGWFTTHANFYFTCFLILLSVLFVDSIREMQKHDVSGEIDLKVVPAAEHLSRVKYFRAQRNFWITGFALFLWMVLKRLCVLISKEADLTENLQTNAIQHHEELTQTKDDLRKTATELAISQKEANEAQKTKKLEMATLQEQVQDLSKCRSEVVTLTGKVEELKMCESEAAQLKKEVAELKKSETDMNILKQQAENNKQAYDELLEEHRKLQEKFNPGAETTKDE